MNKNKITLIAAAFIMLLTLTAYATVENIKCFIKIKNETNAHFHFELLPDLISKPNLDLYFAPGQSMYMPKPFPKPFTIYMSINPNGDYRINNSFHFLENTGIHFPSNEYGEFSIPTIKEAKKLGMPARMINDVIHKLQGIKLKYQCIYDEEKNTQTLEFDLTQKTERNDL